VKKVMRMAISALYAAAFAIVVGSWGICYAYIERGYIAVGGEYFLFPIAFVGAYRVMQFMFKVLEDKSERGGTDNRAGKNV